MIRFLKALPQLILAPVMVSGIAALALFLLGLVPQYIQPPEGSNKEYPSIARAEAEVGFKIALPSYFPSYLAWPPARIYGQRKPVPMTQLLFLSQYSNSETMVIYQIDSDSEELPMALPWFETIHQKTPVTIGISSGILISGVRSDGQSINGAYWRKGDFYFIVVTTRSERELLTIAGSIKTAP